MFFSDFDPLRHRRLRHHLACFKKVFHFAEDPGPPVGRPPDHHPVHSIAVEHFAGLGTGVDISVTDDRNPDRRIVLHLANERPVRFAAIHLGPRAAVDRQCGDTHVLQAQSDLFDVLRLFIPSQTGFDRHGFLHGFDDAAGHLDHQGDIAHHTRSGAPTGDLLHRTTEVDIDDIGIGRLGDPSRLDHRFHQMTVKLDTHGPFGFGDAQFSERLARIADQPVRRDKLGIYHVGTEPLAHIAERRIGHILHRSQEQRAVTQFYVGNLHGIKNKLRTGRLYLFLLSDVSIIVASTLSMRAPSISTTSSRKHSH